MQPVATIAPAGDAVTRVRDGWGGPPVREWIVTVVLVAWLLVGPRIELSALFGSSLRLEDLVILALVPAAVHQLRSRDAVQRRTGIAWVVAAALLAAVVGVALGRVELAPAVLYALRPLEYWVVYPALLWTLHRGGPAAREAVVRALAVVTVVQVGVAVLQAVAGISIGFSKFSAERGAGLTAGPYELGAMCGALACFWFARRRPVLCIVAITGVGLSASRASATAFVVAVAIAVAVGLLRRRPPVRDRASRAASLQTAVVACLLAAVVVLTTSVWFRPVAAALVDRIGNTSISEEWRSTRDAASTVVVPETSAEYREIAYFGVRDAVGGEYALAADSSNFVRFFRWHLLARSTEGDWLLGLGPSFAGPSVDGAYVRIVVETGLLGLAAWLVFASRLLRRQPPWMIAVLLSLLLASLFIDLLFAMRPMILVWTVVALADADADVRRRDPEVREVRA